MGDQAVKAESTPAPTLQEAMHATLAEMAKAEKETTEKPVKAETETEKHESKEADTSTADPLDMLSKESDDLKKAKEEARVPLSRLREVNEKAKAYEKQVKDLEEKLAEQARKMRDLSEDEREEAENLKKLGLKTKADELEDKLEAKREALEELNAKIEESETKAKEIEAKALKSRIAELTAAYDGSNGLPKFDIQELLKYADSENYYPDDPVKLYKMKFQAEIYAAKHKKASSSTKVETSSGKSTEGVMPKAKNSWDNLEDRAKETLAKLG